MKKLLIHSNNTSFNNTELFPLSEQFVFDVDIDKDVDFYINENLTDGNLKLKLEKCDIVFIKVSLSKNYLEYFGLRLAYHIRLTKSLEEKAYLPIVLIAEESIQYLGLTHSEPSILFTKGLYIIKESLDEYDKALKWFNEGITKPLDDLSLFVNSVIINPPANYLSHHSIANEWSILRWSKVLGISTEGDALKDVRINIESLLYYKYLQAKYPIEVEPEKAEFEITGKGRILYIDDEWNKGWSIVLEKFLSSCPDIEFETFKYDFKDKTHEEIIVACKKKIENWNPDAILLDLRLSDTDFKQSYSTLHLSGYKLLKEIKLINPGIQVIIFTASNKVWNFTELQNAGCDDFILKESPDMSTDAGYSRSAISKMALSVSDSLKMSFLKKVYIKITEIKKQISVANNDEEKDFLIRLNNNLDVAFRLLIDTKISAKYFNYAYLQLFQIVEDFCNLSYVFKESTDSYVCINDKEVLVQKTFNDKWESAISFEGGKYRLAHKSINTNPKDKTRRLDTNYKVSAILIFRLGYENSSFLKWTDIYTNRNTKAAHFNINDALNEEAIFTLLDFIKKFISPHKQKEDNIEKGLTVKTFEESLELLRSHFKK